MTNEELEKKTDDELWEIVKRGENLQPHIPQSEANRAKRILDYRMSKKNYQSTSTYNYSGNFSFQGGNNIFGADGKIENTITVKQFLDEIGKIIEEKAPETVEKKNLLNSLKDFMVNDKTGEFVGSLAGSFFKSSTQ